MMKLKTVRPSQSYQLNLPQNVCEQVDERVSSFWLDGGHVVLQLSSFIRDEGPQLKAQHRLDERVKKHKAHWNWWQKKIHPDITIDQATAEFVDDEGLLWIHSYLVWPHLTVYSTISGPKDIVTKSDNWALQSLSSLHLITH
jgi:hypothetical protein